MFIQPVRLFCNFKGNINSEKTNGLEPKESSNKEKIMNSTDAMSILGANNAAAIKNNKAADKVKFALADVEATRKNIDSFVQNMRNEIDETAKNAKELFNETMEQYAKGDETAPDGTVLRKITTDNTKKIMKEFNKDGKVVRKTTFLKGEHIIIEDGLEKFPDKSWKADRIVYYDTKGTPTWYKEGLEYFPDKSWSTKKAIIFSDEKPFSYIKNYRGVDDYVIEKEEEVMFQNGKPDKYIKGLENFPDNSRKFAVYIWFFDGEPMRYLENFIEQNDGAYQATKDMLFFATEPRWYRINSEYYADNSRKAEKEIMFENGEAQNYRENCKVSPEGKIQAEEQYELTDNGWK